MLTIFWSPLGFPPVRTIPKRSYVDTGDFCSATLEEIDQIHPVNTGEDTRRSVFAIPSKEKATSAAVVARSLRRERGM
jgi:hypothetical protein